VHQPADEVAVELLLVRANKLRSGPDAVAEVVEPVEPVLTAVGVASEPLVHSPEKDGDGHGREVVEDHLADVPDTPQRRTGYRVPRLQRE
jgi:hypothetical protein